METIARVPGVEAVAPATALPLAGTGRRVPVSPTATGGSSLNVERTSIGPGFFATLRVAIRAGRMFTAQDTPETRTAVISESFARQMFGASPALGRQVWMDKVAYDVVGVVADYTTNPTEIRFVTPKIYVPLSTDAAKTTSVRFLIRTAGDPTPLVEPVRRALRDAVVGVSVTSAFTLRQILTIGAKEYLAGTAPLFPLIVIGMLLTSSGIYGVLAFAVSRRSRELAIRLAIGADRRQQIRLVIAHSLRLVLMGSACGIALTFALSRLVRAAGGAGSIYDPPLAAFVIPVGIVIVVAALATWIPTRRALRVNPASLLKAT
jgi:ABC-type antimicrobial peptide transport system permease subunit